MEVRRRNNFPAKTSSEQKEEEEKKKKKKKKKNVHASDALPLPIRHTNLLFSFLFLASIFFLMRRWREKIRLSIPLHVVDLAELISVVSLVGSLIYLISFFGIALVQTIVDDEDTANNNNNNNNVKESKEEEVVSSASGADDEDIIASVVAGSVPSYSLESRLGDCRRAAGVRRGALERITGRKIQGLPLDGFDYDSILGQCCEMPIGYVQLPVGVAGPLVLDGRVHYVPMATTEGCLVASTNRGCKALAESGGAVSVVLKDGMTRAPAVRFATAARAAQLKFFLDDPPNFDTLALVFNRR